MRGGGKNVIRSGVGLGEGSYEMSSQTGEV